MLKRPCLRGIREAMARFVDNKLTHSRSLVSAAGGLVTEQPEQPEDPGAVRAAARLSPLRHRLRLRPLCILPPLAYQQLTRRRHRDQRLPRAGGGEAIGGAWSRVRAGRRAPTRLCGRDARLPDCPVLELGAAERCRWSARPAGRAASMHDSLWLAPVCSRAAADTRAVGHDRLLCVVRERHVGPCRNGALHCAQERLQRVRVLHAKDAEEAGGGGVAGCEGSQRGRGCRGLAVAAASSALEQKAAARDLAQI